MIKDNHQNLYTRSTNVVTERQTSICQQITVRILSTHKKKGQLISSIIQFTYCTSAERASSASGSDGTGPKTCRTGSSVDWFLTPAAKEAEAEGNEEDEEESTGWMRRVLRPAGRTIGRSAGRIMLPPPILVEKLRRDWEEVLDLDRKVGIVRNGNNGFGNLGWDGLIHLNSRRRVRWFLPFVNKTRIKKCIDLVFVLSFCTYMAFFTFLC
jgi:hypothetical protein